MILSVRFRVALAAAARSTWSPCGLSMLSQITPWPKRGATEFARTAGWFIAGATLGGVTLGGAIAGVADRLGAAGIEQRTAIALIAGAAFAAAAVDAHLFGFGPPFVHPPGERGVAVEVPAVGLRRRVRLADRRRRHDLRDDRGRPAHDRRRRARRERVGRGGDRRVLRTRTGLAVLLGARLRHTGRAPRVPSPLRRVGEPVGRA